jgi:hypothetical protein
MKCIIPVIFGSLIAVGLLPTGAARAQEATKDASQDTSTGTPLDLADHRFAFHRVDNGYLRLDLRSGDVAQCTQRGTGWACALVPDERAAMDSEIARLQRENVGLKSALLERGLPLPSGMTADAAPATPPVAVAPGPQAPKPERPGAAAPDLRLPSDAELDRVMAMMDRVWRHLVEMMGNLQRDLQKKG